MVGTNAHQTTVAAGGLKEDLARTGPTRNLMSGRCPANIFEQKRVKAFRNDHPPPSGGRGSSLPAGQRLLAGKRLLADPPIPPYRGWPRPKIPNKKKYCDH